VEEEMPTKNYPITASFLKISTVKATLFLGVKMFLHMYFLHSLSNLGETEYKDSEHNAVKHFFNFGKIGARNAKLLL
jgi:hypothetical protein